MLQSILAPNPSPMTLNGTRTYIVGREQPVVIDPGPYLGAHVDAIVAALAGRTPACILLTHAHPDHADAAPALARRTGAPVRMGAGSAQGWPSWGDVHTRDIGHGDRVETDAGPLLAVRTPGHAPEHLCFLLESADRPLVAGDMFMGGADTTLVAWPEGDLGAYLLSLDRLEALAPGTIHPAHGPDIADAEAAIGRYRAHRAERIGQVERALSAGPAAAGELIDRVYGAELQPALRRAAEGSLRAILAHLQGTGRVRQDDIRFSLTSSATS